MCKRYVDPLPLECPQLETWPATQTCAPTGNQTSDLCRLALSPLSHTSQGSLVNLNQNSKLKNHCAQYNKNATYVAIYIFARENAFEKHTFVVFACSASTGCSLGDQDSPIGYALERT